MKKHTSKLIALVLALCLCLSLSVSAFAAEIDSSGGSGSTPVNLSSTSDGTEGGDPSATAVRSLDFPAQGGGQLVVAEAMPFLQKYDITFLRPPTICPGCFSVQRDRRLCPPEPPPQQIGSP